MLGNSSVAIFIFNAIVPLVGMVVLTNMSFTSGSATKVIAVLIFIVGLMWIVFGATLARRLNNGYVFLLPSGQAFRSYSKTQDKKMAGAALGSALFLDTFASTILMNNLPFPLNYFYYMGMFPVIPFAVFGFLPGILTWSSMGVLVSLAGVMDAGGDGTEYVEAKRIHWFYSLNEADRERVREGSDLEGEEEDESDQDSVDEEAGRGRRSKPDVDSL